MLICTPYRIGTLDDSWLMSQQIGDEGVSVDLGGRVWGRIYKKWTCLGLSWLNIFNISIKVNQSCQGCLSLLSVQPCRFTGSVTADPRISRRWKTTRRFWGPMRTFSSEHFLQGWNPGNFRLFNFKPKLSFFEWITKLTIRVNSWIFNNSR